MALLQITDITASGARVTHYGIDEMEVCVPATWEAAAVTEFAESKLNCVAGHRWQISGKRHTCGFETGFAHVQLRAIRGESPTPVAPSSSVGPNSTSKRGIHVNAIINFSAAAEKSGELDKTAESFELLAQWLRAKALAAKARDAQDQSLARRYEAEAETVNSRLLAQFRGNLLLI